jgi:amidase
MIDLERFSTTDALGLAELVRGGEATAEELAALATEACERVDGRLRAVVELLPAQIGDVEVAAPFAGVPFLLKDLGATAAGVRSERGSRFAAGLVAERDTELMRRFRAAGLVLVGRSAASELGLLPVTETALNGATCTPWSPAHSSGGSSGGAAAAVAAGIVPIAHANDGGGSIRVPAACCGVVGLKPSRGRVSSAPGGSDPIFGWAVELAVTRTVRDVAALLDAVAGPAPGDPYALAPPAQSFLDAARRPPTGLRVAVCASSWTSVPVDPENAEAAGLTGQLLEALGHNVVERAPDVDWEAFLSVEVAVWTAVLAHRVDALAAQTGREANADSVEATSLVMLEHGRRVGRAELLDALDGMNDIARRVALLFEEVDVLVTPTLPGPPLELGAFSSRDFRSAREVVAEWATHESFTSLFNLTGQPAISIPLHEHASRLPLGIQLVGRPGGEETLVALAAQLEDARPWRGRVPPIHVTAPEKGRAT